jgi:iron complex transport system substrate-binding protein
MRHFVWIFALSITISCSVKPESKNRLEPVFIPSYAKGFLVEKFNDTKVLSIISDMGDKDTIRYVLRESDKKVPFELNHLTIIDIPVGRIIPTSSTFIPYLEELRVDSAIIAFPNINYISSDSVYVRALNKEIIDIGENEMMNLELIYNLKPDLLMAFSLNGKISGHDFLERANIPIIYNGDWREKTPLARSEWMYVYGYLFSEVDLADDYFKTLADNYNKLKKSEIDIEKTVISGSVFNGIWYAPGGNSFMATFYKDAGLNYIYSSNQQTGSISLDPEAALFESKDAKYWFAPDNKTSMNALINSNTLYNKLKSVENNEVFSYALKKSKNGSYIYFDQAPLHPDWVLSDILYFTSEDSRSPNYKTKLFERLN